MRVAAVSRLPHKPAGYSTVWETLRHLRWSQVFFRIKRRLLPCPARVPLPLLWDAPRPRLARAANADRAFFDGQNRFRFNNEERVFEGDWNTPGARKLWLYNLHYMAWLFDLEKAEEREAWIRRWIEDNPPVKGGNGWEPYPLSLRLFNWCKHYSLAGHAPDPRVMQSMGRQASRLLSDLEFHLDGNHLLENLLALAFVGFYLDRRNPGAARTGGRIRRLLESALSDQFLADGGHFELSPMYHAILLERILDLINHWPDQYNPFPGLEDRLRSIAWKALDWLEIMTVGGRFALFNDSAYDAAPEAARLLEYGNLLLSRGSLPKAPLWALEASGYFRAEAGPAIVLFDAGKLGPDHQMGHAQGDMLSFCLWLGGSPVLVHPGNFEYLPGPMRDFCRSTAAHNTLVVDGQEQADWWASHRVGWRGHPLEVSASVDPEGGSISMQGAHNGYSRLSGAPIHRRTIELSATSLVIRDSLSAETGRAVRIYFHFHPDCILEARNGTIEIRSAGGGMVLEADHPMRVEDSWYCPEFGLRFGNRAVVVEMAGLQSVVRIRFES